MNKIKTVTLFFQEGSSDKLYQATLWEESGLYTVEVEWGKRNSPLNRGNKAIKVSLAVAEKTIEKLLREKTNKGYEQVTKEVAPQAVAPPVGHGSGSKVAGAARKKLPQAAQLLNAIEDEELESFLNDPAIIAQQKLDGVRILTHRQDEVIATNRTGHITELHLEISQGLRSFPKGSVLDGEVVSAVAGPLYWLFDILQHGQEDLRGLGYAARHRRLLTAASALPIERFGVVPMAESAAEKRALLDKLRQDRAEGIVFKKKEAPYQPGRPSSGGDQRKYKFIKGADVFITTNAGNAYQMAVYADGVLREVGKVFAGTTNESRRQLDAQLAAGERPVAEVRYLYATDDDLLFQPTFVQIRDDKEPEECLFSQLKHTNKAASPAEKPAAAKPTEKKVAAKKPAAKKPAK
jgi:bifunctional non-homologous end joining protein LigD